MRRKQKKKHPLRKFLLSLLAVLLCVSMVICAFFGVRGYQMYKDAAAEKPVSEISHIITISGTITSGRSRDSLAFFYVDF